jgi:hypothetical protein
MNRKSLRLLAAAALAISFNAHAQLTSVDTDLGTIGVSWFSNTAWLG